jgi:soluble lytic murein transglycosylase-like protein
MKILNRILLILCLLNACSVNTNQRELDPAELRLLQLQKQREEIEAIQKITNQEDWQNAFLTKKSLYDSKNVADYQHLLNLFNALIEHQVFQKNRDFQKKWMHIKLYPAKILGKLDCQVQATELYLKLSQELKGIDDLLALREEALFFAGFEQYEIENYKTAIEIWQELTRHQGIVPTQTLTSNRSQWVKNAEWYYAWSLYLTEHEQAADFLAHLGQPESQGKSDHRIALYWASEAYQRSKDIAKAKTLRAQLLKENKLDYYTILLMKKYPQDHRFDHLYPSNQRKQFFQILYQTEIDQWLERFKKPQTQSLTQSQILSFILKESNFNPKAKSKANAMGLMQLLQKTADALVQYSKRNAFDDEISAYTLPVDLYDPTTNIALGTMYLTLLHQQYQKQLVLTSIAYNAGPMALQKWIKRNRLKSPQIELDLFIEKIPYKEAREYAKKIIEFEAHYRLFYQEDSLESIAKSLTMLLNLEINETILF